MPISKFCPTPKIDSSEISESFLLLQIFIVSVALSMGRLKFFIDFQINKPPVLMSRVKKIKSPYIEAPILHVSFSMT